MKVEYIHPFIKATENTFQEVIRISINAGSPYVYQGNKDLMEVSAIIGLAGEAQGAVILSFEKESCLKISKNFTGIDSQHIDENVTDAIGEIVNIIAGNAKEGLMQYRIYISLPKVIIGSADLRMPKNTPTITVPFQSDLGSFNLTVGLRDDPS